MNCCNYINGTKYSGMVQVKFVQDSLWKSLSDMVCLKMMEGTFFRSISHERTKIRDTSLAFLQWGLKSNWSKKLFFKKVEAYCKIAWNEQHNMHNIIFQCYYKVTCKVLFFHHFTSIVITYKSYTVTNILGSFQPNWVRVWNWCSQILFKYLRFNCFYKRSISW